MKVGRHQRYGIKSHEAGQAVIEYVLLLSIAIGAALEIYSAFNGKIREGYGVLNAELEKNLQTGGFAETVEWDR